MDGLRNDLSDILSFPSNFWDSCLAATWWGMVAGQSSLSAVRLWPISNVMLAKIRVIKCLRTLGSYCRSQAESLPRCAPAVHSCLSQQCLWVSHGAPSLCKEGPLTQSAPHFCTLHLPCSSSSAYLCTKVKVEKLRVSQNLTLMPAVLWLCAGICLLWTFWGFLLPLGHMATLKWFPQNSCCCDAAAREELWV